MIKFNRLKKQPIYFYSKIAPLGKVLKIKVSEGIHMLFRARTLDRAVLKDVWTKDAYSKAGFEIRESDTVIDIGGHIGAFTVFAAKKAAKGQIYTFEPFSENYEMLLSNVKLNHIKNAVIENAAIGKEDGISKLYIRPKELTKGEIAYNSGGHSFHLIKDSNISVEVKTYMLDSVIEKHKLRNVDFLKMDCEGAEYEIIFNTSKETLSRISKIVMECHPYENYTYDDMHDFLEDNGFECLSSKDRHYNLYLIYAIRRNQG